MNSLNKVFLIANMTLFVAALISNAVLLNRHIKYDNTCKVLDESVEVFYIAQKDLLQQQKQFLNTQQEFKRIQDEFNKEQLRTINIITKFQRNISGY